MSEEIDRLKKEYELAYYKSERKLALQRKQFDLEVELRRVTRDLQFMDQEETKNTDITYFLPTTKGHVLEMIAESENRILDIIRKSYGG